MLPKIIGHARLKHFMEGGDEALLVESVLVAAAGRGLGLGRMLMAEVEQHARRLGYSRLVLSTCDKQVSHQACCTADIRIHATLATPNT